MAVGSVGEERRGRFEENLELSGELRGHQPGLLPSNRSEPLRAGVFRDMCVINPSIHPFVHSR